MSEVLPGATAVVREAVGCFHHWENLQAAVDELLVNGFDRAEISMLAGEKAVEQKLGHVYQKVSDLEDDPEAPRIAFVGRDSVTEGKASAIGGAGVRRRRCRGRRGRRLGRRARLGDRRGAGGRRRRCGTGYGAGPGAGTWPRQGHGSADRQGRPAAVGAHQRRRARTPGASSILRQARRRRRARPRVRGGRNAGSQSARRLAARSVPAAGARSRRAAMPRRRHRRARRWLRYGPAVRRRLRCAAPAAGRRPRAPRRSRRRPW